MLAWILSSSLLIAGVLLIRFFLRGRLDSRLQHALWGLVLLRLLLPFSLGDSFLSVTNLLPRELPPAVSVTAPASPVLKEEPTAPSPAKPLPEGAIALTPKPPTPNPKPAEDPSAVDPQAFPFREIWISGAALLGCWFLGSNLILWRRLRKTRRPLAIEGVSRPVYHSPAVETPCLFGLLRPAVYLTEEAAAEKMLCRHAVAHELTHFRHGDHIFSLLRGAVLALHWYNPLVWAAAFCSRSDAELACDESTIRRLGEEERASYGRTLLRLTCEKRTNLLIAATTMTGSHHEIKERIMSITSKPKTSLCTLVLVLLTALLAVGCTFTGPKEPGSVSPIESPQAAMTALFVEKEDISFSLQMAEDDSERSFTVTDPLVAEFLTLLMDKYHWSPAEAPSPEAAEYRLTVSTPNKGQVMTFWAGEESLVQYEQDGKVTCWEGKAIEEPSVPFGSLVLEEYDNLEADPRRIAFTGPQTPQEAAEVFVKSSYGSHLMTISPLNEYGILSYDLVDYEIMEISPDQTAVVGSFTYAFTPRFSDSPAIWAGNTGKGTGKWEGMLTAYRQFALRKMDDRWQCIEVGTGGVRLPAGAEEEDILAAVDKALADYHAGTVDTEKPSAGELYFQPVPEGCVLPETVKSAAEYTILPKNGTDGDRLILTTADGKWEIHFHIAELCIESDPPQEDNPLTMVTSVRFQQKEA